MISSLFGLNLISFYSLRLCVKLLSSQIHHIITIIRHIKFFGTQSLSILVLQSKRQHMETSLIQTNGLSYSYGRQLILKELDLCVERGSIYGFLGPNGSGKTTTLSLLLGLLKMQQGRIQLFGKELRTHRSEILKKIGTLVEAPSLYGQLTAKENLEVYRSIYGVEKERIQEVLKIVGLEDTGSKQARKFSLGMKQRLAIALALLPRPELLILDEPTNGLDPQGILELRSLIRRLNREEGITILVSSHILSEVEKMVSHVGIIFRGDLLFQGPLNQLQRIQQSKTRLTIRTNDDLRAMELLKCYDVEMEAETISVAVSEPAQVAEVSRLLHNGALDVFLLQPRTQDLEQLFLQLTNQRS